MKKCLVTILMPVFKPNLEWLEIAIMSILNQTYDNFELLLLYEPYDNDGVIELVNRIRDDRINIIETPKQSGLPKSLNIGMRLAKGKYIARMDADDYSLPNRIDKQVSYMELHPNVSVLGTPVKLMGKNEYWFNEHMKNMFARSIRMVFSNSGGVAHPTAMFRRDFFENNNISYNEELRGSEDYYLWVDIICNGGTIETLTESLLEYRISDNQASNIMASKMIKWDLLAKKKMFNHIYGDSIDFDHMYEILLKSNFDSNDVQDFFCYFSDMINYNNALCNECKYYYNRELAYQWVRCALLNLRKNFKFSMFERKYFFNIVEYKYWSYIVKKIIFDRVLSLCY